MVSSAREKSGYQELHFLQFRRWQGPLTANADVFESTRRNFLRREHVAAVHEQGSFHQTPHRLNSTPEA
jgi:hypothetical protein